MSSPLSSPLIGIVRFPGTNCEFDTASALAQLGARTKLLCSHERTLDGPFTAPAAAPVNAPVSAPVDVQVNAPVDAPIDAIVIPGGFAHGDYLRTGAIARLEPIMEAVTRFAAAGGPVVGICNGFQVLTEAGLLPGALRANAGLSFVCGPQRLTMTSSGHVLSHGLSPPEELSVPINHFEGNYVCDRATLARLKRNDQVVMRYVGNPNGSVDDIAGVCNEARNVVGLMPHPERASSKMLGSADGRKLLESLVVAADNHRRASSKSAAGVSGA